ncbi:hypothetical protein [Xanthomonas sp. 1678]|uniref:hypothetical protein n=1 Tax=Xanthomonas sp. 1678 TaxID=3158788 RepID=UPI0028574C74|nr:hypothetical protein [Xanthomonas translucens]
MVTKPTKKRAVAKLPKKQELDLFRRSLEKAGQLQIGAEPLKPGVTHVVVEGVDGEVLVRRRFSAI